MAILIVRSLGGTFESLNHFPMVPLLGIYPLTDSPDTKPMKFDY